MKNSITILAVAILMVAGTNAQIKKPTVKVTTTNIKTNTALQGVKVNDLSRLKTVADFEKLNIPVQQMTKEKLNAKPTQTWKISATQLSYAQLKLDYFRGWLSNNEFQMRGQYLMSGQNYDHNLAENIDQQWRRRGTTDDPYLFWICPLGIKFRASADIEYKLKLKISDTSIPSMGDIFVVQNELYISRISKSDSGDYYYVFTPEKSEEITLQFSSGVIADSNFWESISFTEIRIDRIN